MCGGYTTQQDGAYLAQKHLVDLIGQLGAEVDADRRRPVGGNLGQREDTDPHLGRDGERGHNHLHGAGWQKHPKGGVGGWVGVGGRITCAMSSTSGLEKAQNSPAYGTRTRMCVGPSVKGVDMSAVESASMTCHAEGGRGRGISTYTEG